MILHLISKVTLISKNEVGRKTTNTVTLYFHARNFLRRVFPELVVESSIAGTSCPFGCCSLFISVCVCSVISVMYPNVFNSPPEWQILKCCGAVLIIIIIVFLWVDIAV